MGAFHAGQSAQNIFLVKMKKVRDGKDEGKRCKCVSIKSRNLGMRLLCDFISSHRRTQGRAALVRVLKIYF